MSTDAKDSEAGRLYTIDQVADLLCVSRRTVYRLIAAGDLPQPLEVRGARRLSRADVCDYLDRLTRSRTQRKQNQASAANTSSPSRGSDPRGWRTG